MSEDDFSGKKEEMKKSIFMKRKSNDNLSPSPKSLDDSKKKSADPNKKKSPGSASPRASEERKSPERKIPNPFSFTHAKKATNDIIQNEILKNEILKRKTEEMNLKKGSSLLVNYSQFKNNLKLKYCFNFRTSAPANLSSPAPHRRAARAPALMTQTMKYRR